MGLSANGSEKHLIFYHIFSDFLLFFEFLKFKTKNGESYRNSFSRTLAKTKKKIAKFRRKIKPWPEFDSTPARTMGCRAFSLTAEDASDATRGAASLPLPRLCQWRTTT